MPSEARQKKIMEKLNRAQKCSILGPQNLESRGGGARAPPGSAPDLLNALGFIWLMMWLYRQLPVDIAN